ncbi:hypothetical protein M5C99_11990 [Acidovorax sp. NCPPB 2350]|nr:hypothetical protein M5C99_11990 [Acidovorax sp. NCPPB 2350]
MPTSLPAARRQRRTRTLALWMWLAMALVLAPALGRVHQVVHGPTAGAAQAVDRAGGHGGHAHPAGVLEALFTGHAGSDCHLLDQSLFGDALPPAPLPAPAPGAVPVPPSLPATGIGARPSRTFLARAPPEPTRA